uniref:SAM domain-containing protein n=2 Tax=Rhodosorus marinus TaxID=101924 RepID=A0A7S3EMN2_9RHOD|mmetsp:Transcript_44621/g.173064  ORF Transcript_44621/g.173064 Transcript_44621/m.173064 type:complete len:303 (+) Transcript_44621:561-1469(+)
MNRAAQDSLLRSRTKKKLDRQQASNAVERRARRASSSSIAEDESLRDFLEGLREKHLSSARSEFIGRDALVDVIGVDDVVDWINAIGYPEYANKFVENEVDGRTLKTITQQELREEIGVTIPKHRSDILRRLDGLIMSTSRAQLDPIPEIGRVLSLLSNVRTYQSWTLVGIQLFIFSVGYMRLGPLIRPVWLVATGSLFAAVSAIGVFTVRSGRNNSSAYPLGRKQPSPNSGPSRTPPLSSLKQYAGVSYRRFLAVLRNSSPNRRVLTPAYRAVVVLAVIELVIFLLTIGSMIATLVYRPDD